MGEIVYRTLEVPSGYASPVIARYLWQLDDQNRRLLAATTDLTPDALQWQPAPGFNTMGMLFAHVALNEVHMAHVMIEGRTASDVPGILNGLGPDDDGMPLPEEGKPPAVFANKSMEDFVDLLKRAREETRRIARPLTDADLDRRVTRHPPDGSTRIYNVDWTLYHFVEHLAGHHAQILQLKHLYQHRHAHA